MSVAHRLRGIYEQALSTVESQCKSFLEAPSHSTILFGHENQLKPWGRGKADIYGYGQIYPCATPRSRRGLVDVHTSGWSTSKQALSPNTAVKEECRFSAWPALLNILNTNDLDQVTILNIHGYIEMLHKNPTSRVLKNNPHWAKHRTTLFSYGGFTEPISGPLDKISKPCL